MKYYRVLLIFCFTSLLAACTSVFGNQTEGSGNVITEKRVVENFTSLELTCSANVSLAQGEPLAVTITGEDNIIPLITTKVSGSQLSIAVKPLSSYSLTKPLTVHIVAPVLTSIRVTGSGDVDANKWIGDTLELITTGSGDIQIGSLEAASLSAGLSGSGDISINQGKVSGSQTITVSGSGNYEAVSMESSEAKAATSGSGNITVWVIKKLLAQISGSGNIQYYGSPWVDQVDTGSGTVEKLDDQP